MFTKYRTNKIICHLARLEAEFNILKELLLLVPDDSKLQFSLQHSFSSRMGEIEFLRRKLFLLGGVK